MITFGIILLIIGFLLHLHFLWIIGIILLVLGLIAAAFGAMDRAIFGRRHYF